MPPNTTDTMHTPKIKSALELMRTSINGRLDGYQHEGVRWMLFRELESEVPSGILADDMGGLPRPHCGSLRSVVGVLFWVFLLFL